MISDRFSVPGATGNLGKKRETGIDNLRESDKIEKTRKMSINDYKSSFHYLALQAGQSGLSFEEFLLYFSNKDIGKLDLAISETILRQAFYERLGSFYNQNIISCLEEFKMIASRNVSLEKCQAPILSMTFPGINCRAFT